MSSSAHVWWAERLSVKSAWPLVLYEETSVAGKYVGSASLERTRTTKNSASLNVKGRRKQAKRSKGPAERSAAFGGLLSLGFLNLAAAWRLSPWFMSIVRAFYSRCCRCYGKHALLWPRSPWYKSVTSLGSVSSRFTQPRGLRPSVCKSRRDLHLVM